jgi:peptidoglycan hydrolase-like protein with peptidoglycan-binding domain
MLKKGDMGNSVRKLQALLGLRRDGNFGPLTEAAVMKFQQVHQLLADGKVGPKTWAALGVK